MELDLDAIKKRLFNLSDEALLKILGVDKDKYEEAVIELAAIEIDTRGLKGEEDSQDEAMDVEPGKKEKALNAIAWLVGASFGLPLGLYLGRSLIAPVALGIVILILGRKLLPENKKRYLIAVAVQGSQVLWGAIGLIYVGRYSIELLYISIFAVALIRLMLRPSLIMVILITMIQAIGLIANFSSLNLMDLGVNVNRVLISSILWRSLGLFLMWWAFYRNKRVNNQN